MQIKVGQWMKKCSFSTVNSSYGARRATVDKKHTWIWNSK